MPIEPVGRPPLHWWKKMRAQIGKNPKYQKRSEESKDRITAGIWQNYDDKTKRKLRAQYAGKEKDEKDFGGWTTQNLDWERGFREGERKTEDRQRGIETQRSRTPQLHAKQGEQLAAYSDEDNPARIEQRRERQAGLRYRAGERKQQHQKPGAVVANVRGKATQPEPGIIRPFKEPEKQGKPMYQGAGEEPTYDELSDVVAGKAGLHPDVEDVQDHPGIACDKAHPGEHHASWKIRNKDADAEWKMLYGNRGPQVLPMKIKRYSLFMPLKSHVCTKGFGDIQKGDLIVEGFVSAPIKDLQGDVLELTALTQAKAAMTQPPHNLVWLDHESPYARPIENQGTPPIGKFFESKIMKIAGLPALWARMVVNKAHPQFQKVAYELKNGFYNAFSMEFIPDPDGQQQKWVGNKLVNTISRIKYFATSLVRAPANEVATVTRVYEKNVGMIPVASFPESLGNFAPIRVYERAFTNSSRFMPIRIKSAIGFGQYVMEKGENLQTKQSLKEAEPENEPEPELEAEPEPWTGQESDFAQRPRLTAGQKPTQKEAEPEPEAEAEPEGDDGPLAMRGSADDEGTDDDDEALQEKAGNPEYPYSRKDYDRETGYTAPERATTAIGEWGDPALEKARFVKRLKALELRHANIEAYLKDVGNSINRLGVYAQRQTAFMKAFAQSQGIDTKGIDEGLAPDTLGVYDDFATITDEQKPPEVKPGKLKPRTQRFISTFPTKDEDIEEADDQEVGGEPVGKNLQKHIDAMVMKSVEKAMQRKIVVRKGYAEHAGPLPESMRRMQAIKNDDGSLESQLGINDLAGGV